MCSVLPDLQRGEEVQGHRLLRGLYRVPQALRQDGERHDDARGAGAHPPLTRGEVGSVITVLIISSYR